MKSDQNKKQISKKEIESKKIREGWAEAAKEAHENGDDELLMDFSNDLDDKEWDWSDVSEK